MYFAAGPLNALSPIKGLTAITFFLIFDNSFLTPLIDNIGPILVSGLPGAMITRSESCIALIASGLGRALSAPMYWIPSTSSFPLYFTQYSWRWTSPLLVVILVSQLL